MNKSSLERINFFHGFFTTADDWNKAQNYHTEKDRFHNKYLHIPGVVFEDDRLKVTAVSQGKVVNVAPGYAIDGEGHDLYLPGPKQITFVPSKYRDPGIVYVIIKHNEEKIDKRPSAANPDYYDYAFVREEPLVEITTLEPDNHNAIELARIRLSEDATRLRDADDADNPKENEIDLRNVKEAGSKGKHEKARLADLADKVAESTEGGTYVNIKGTFSITLETTSEEGTHRFYLASVYPDKEAQIRWRIERTRSTAGNIQYKLIVENLSRKAVNVHYIVYRLL